MSDFKRNLKAELQALAAQATPSQDGWNQISSRIESIDLEVENTMDMPRKLPENKSRLLVLAAAGVALVLLAAAALLLNRQDGDPEKGPADRVETVESTTSTVAATTTSTTALPPEPEALTLSPSIESGPNLSGKFTTDAMGTPMEFETDGVLQLVLHAPGDMLIVVPTSPVTQSLEIARISGFYDAAQSDAPQAGVVGAIPPDQIDTWLEGSHFFAEQDRTTTVAGYPARVLDLRLDDATPVLDDSCAEPEERACRYIYTKSEPIMDRHQAVYGEIVSVPFFTGEEIRLWVIDLQDQDPLVFAASSSEPSEFDAPFFSTIEQLVESITLGEPAPVTVPTERELAVAELLSADEARTLAQQLADGLEEQDYDKMIAALGEDGRWVDLRRQEKATSADLETFFASVPLTFQSIEIQQGLPVVGGYLFPAGRGFVGANIELPLSLIITVDEDGVIRAGDYYG